jgi:hypothetical protein
MNQARLPVSSDSQSLPAGSQRREGILKLRFSSFATPLSVAGLTIILAACSGAGDLPAAQDVDPAAPLVNSEALSDGSTGSLREAIAPTASAPPLRADEIRGFLEQGSVEVATLCPSEAARSGSTEHRKIAYFETTHYWIEICAQANGGLSYYGRKRDNPDLDLAIAAYPLGDRPHAFKAQNGNTTYQINPDELVVTQNGVPIIREPVLRAIVDQ